MRLTFGLGMLVVFITYGIAFVIIWYMMLITERTENYFLKMATYLVGIALMGGAFYCNRIWFDCAEVIHIRGRDYAHHSWMFYYPADNGHKYPVKLGEVYLYDSEETDTNLVLTPVYYHSNPDSLGREVVNPRPPIRVLPGFHVLDTVPLFIFKTPSSEREYVLSTEELIVYHLGRKGEDDVPDYYLKLIYEPPQMFEGN